jgi:hypothetical protein
MAFPPVHEQPDPTLVLRKTQGNLHLFAAGNPSVDACISWIIR